MVSTDGLTTFAENTWCPGCGNFGIFNAVKTAVRKLEEKGISRERIVMTAGIGCHAKIFDYLKISGFYSLHGRSMATAQGIKLANPELKVVDFGGDGDSYGEGLAHMIFAAKRNADITVIVHNNGAYALTTGQVSPTSERGFRGPSTPMGSIEDPLNPLVLLLEAGATFIARGYSAKMGHLTDLIVEAIEHEGFSIIDVLQPSVVFTNYYEKYNELTELIEQPPETVEDSLKLMKAKDKFYIGLLYKRTKPAFHKALYGDFNPVKDRLSKDTRRAKISAMLKNE